MRQRQLLLCLPLAACAFAAHGETTLCTAITTVPIAITVQGVYCLNADLQYTSPSGNAIDVQTNNVIIDLNGHKLGGLPAGPGTSAIGIFGGDRKNVTIRNGTVRGFKVGIQFTDSTAPNYVNSSAHVIEGVRADFNTTIGLQIDGNGNIVRNNQVVSTGGNLANAATSGIVINGPGARVINNDVIGTNAAGTAPTSTGIALVTSAGSVISDNRIANTTYVGGTSAMGIDLVACDGCAVSGNRISNASVQASTVGIYSQPGDDLMITDNRIARMAVGVQFGSGTGTYMNNLVRGANTAYSGGTAAGTTNF